MSASRNICLGIDTTGSWCSIALVDDANVLTFAREAMNRGQAERLGPMVQEAFLKTGINAKSLTKISVCSGPGSFTGLRVGMAFAKGLALPHQIPIVGISNLEIWALTQDPRQNERVLCVADVRRNQVFWQVFENGVPLAAPALTNIETAQSQLTPETHLTPETKCVGNGAHLLGNYEQQDSYVCPARLAWIGIDRHVKTHPPQPLYHRPPDAKLPGGKSL